MLETKLDIFYKLKDEKRIRDICIILNKSIEDILDIDANFTYFGSKNDGDFTIYNQNKHNKNKAIDLSMRLYYPQREGFYYDKEAQGLDDDEFDEYIERKYNQSKLLYAEILWFSVTPSGKGIGSNIVSEIIESLKVVEDIEFILLHPKNDKAKRFWMKNLFIQDNNRISLSRKIKPSVCNKLVYKY